MIDTELLPEILTPGETAALFGVDVKTIVRWSKAGKIPHFKTLGGHRRFYKGDVDELLQRQKSKKQGS